MQPNALRRKGDRAMKLLSAKEIARLMNISPRKLEQMIVAGELSGYVKLGRVRRWREDDIRKWLEDKFSKNQPQSNVRGSTET